MSECCCCRETYRRGTNDALTCNPCGHGICEPCLIQWRRSGRSNSNTCPQCRRIITSTVVNRDLMDIIEQQSSQANVVSNNIFPSESQNAPGESKNEPGESQNAPGESQNAPGETRNNSSLFTFQNIDSKKKGETIIGKSQFMACVLDNSGSMTCPDGKSVVFDKCEPGKFKIIQGVSRWRELEEKTNAIADYNIKINMPAVYYLLNPMYHNKWVEGQDFILIDPSKENYQENLRILKEEILDEKNIRGSTPLDVITRHVRQSLHSFVSNSNMKTYNICYNVLTDGQPNDKRLFENELRYLANNFNIFLAINLTTNNNSIIEYYNDLDVKIGSELGGMDVMDDLQGEQLEVIKAGNTFITYSYDIHVCRMAGCNSVVADELDEHVLSVFHANKLVKELLGCPQDLPHWTDRENYIKKVTQLNTKVYDLYNRSYRDLINTSKLNNMIWYYEQQKLMEKFFIEYPPWMWLSGLCVLVSLYCLV